MAYGFSISGKQKVKTMKINFKKEFGLTLRVYDGRSFADDDSTIAQIRTVKTAGELEIKRNIKVGNLEDRIQKDFGIKVQIAGSDDSYLCDNDLTLAKAQEADEKKMERKKKKASKNNPTDSNVIALIEARYSNHESFDEMISDIKGGGYFVYWADKIFEDDFGKEKAIAKELYKLELANCESSSDLTLQMARKVMSESQLNDKVWGKELCQKALSMTEDSQDITRIADTIIEYFADKEQAVVLYKDAIDKASESSDYLRVGESIAEILDDRSWAKEIFQMAIDASKSSADLLSIVSSLNSESGMNDKEWGKKVSQQAIDIAGDDNERQEVLLNIKTRFEKVEPWIEELAKRFNLTLTSIISFVAVHCGEVGFGELTGKKLDKFKELFDSKTLDQSEFIDTPFEIASEYFTGVFVDEDALEEWNIPDVVVNESGTLGIPTVNDEYKPGIYFLYTILADEYQVDLPTDDVDSLEFSGPKIDFSYLEPDFEAGEISEFILAHNVTLNGENENIYDYMTDLGGMRQSVLIPRSCNPVLM